MNLVGYDAMAMTVIMNLITRSPYYASRKSGLSSCLLSANITRKVPASACLKPWALFKRQDLKNCRYWPDDG
ncbi:hypothetical protein DMH88_12905 [Escherichia coli]|nr:hypothetical protein [Escherichia coli]